MARLRHGRGGRPVRHVGENPLDVERFVEYDDRALPYIALHLLRFRLIGEDTHDPEVLRRAVEAGRAELDHDQAVKSLLE